jgi:molecular chaperone DnaK (HSP70)
VPRNAPLPYSVTETFRLVHRNQKLVHLKFYNLVNEVEESIGDLWLGIDGNEHKKDSDGDLPRVELTVEVDENNLVLKAARAFAEANRDAEMSYLTAQCGGAPSILVQAALQAEDSGNPLAR